MYHIDHAIKLCHWIIDFYKLNPQRYAHTELNASTTIDYLTQSFQLSTAIGCNNCKENAEGVKIFSFFKKPKVKKKDYFIRRKRMRIKRYNKSDQQQTLIIYFWFQTVFLSYWAHFPNAECYWSCIVFGLYHICKALLTETEMF